MQYAVNDKLESVDNELIEHGLTSAPTQYRLYGRRELTMRHSIDWWQTQNHTTTKNNT